MKKILFTKKNLLIITAVIVIGSGGTVFAVQQLKEDKPATSTEPAQNPKEADIITVDDGPPTDSEKKAILERNEQLLNSNQSTQTKSVTPVITSAMDNGSEIIVSAYVSGVIEEGGTCTMSATKDGKEVLKTVTGIADASNTACPPFFVNDSEFSQKGSWTVKVSYKSAKAEGASQTKTLTVQ